MMAEPMQDQIHWLIRKNVPQPATDRDEESEVTLVNILGPYRSEQVRAMVERGMLAADDELCPENSYWFGLHETAEVKKFLGIDRVIIARVAPDGESTQPDLEITRPDMSDLDPESTGIITIKKPEPSQPASSRYGETAKADMKAKSGAAPTAQEIARQFQRVSLTTAAVPVKSNDCGQRNPVMEKSQAWIIIITLGMAAILLGFIWVIRSLRLG